MYQGNSPGTTPTQKQGWNMFDHRVIFAYFCLQSSFYFHLAAVFHRTRSWWHRQNAGGALPLRVWSLESDGAVCRATTRRPWKTSDKTVQPSNGLSIRNNDNSQSDSRLRESTLVSVSHVDTKTNMNTVSKMPSQLCTVATVPGSLGKLYFLWSFH